MEQRFAGRGRKDLHDLHNNLLNVFPTEQQCLIIQMQTLTNKWIALAADIAVYFRIIIFKLLKLHYNVQSLFCTVRVIYSDL